MDFARARGPMSVVTRFSRGSGQDKEQRHGPIRHRRHRWRSGGIDRGDRLRRPRFLGGADRAGGRRRSAHHGADGRFHPFIDQLGLWDSVRPHAAALATLRIIDGTNRLLRAPVASFRSSEIGLDAFGYNIPNAPFLDVLAERIAATPAITRKETVVEAFDLQSEGVRLTLADGETIERLWRSAPMANNRRPERLPASA